MRKSLSILLTVGLLLLSFPVTLWAADYDPTASFTISPSRGSLESTFTFDASGSYDQRGLSTSLDYRWNFDYSGGGSYSNWSSSETTSHQYTEAGTMTVALEVRDEEGYTDKTYGTVTVSATAVFTGWFDVSETEGDTSTVFLFEGDVSSPLSIPASEYEFRWDFNGDGEYDTEYSSSAIVYYSYSETGYFNPRMEILSPDGDTLEVIGYDDNDDNDTSYVFVSESGNPQASMTVYPTSGSTNTMFYFDGSRSFDSQDHFDIEFRWDLDGDGSFEIDWGDTTDPTTHFDTPGTYTVTLQIRDTDEEIDEVTTTITIDDDDFGPEANFSITSDSGLIDKTIGTTSTTFTFNASGSDDEEDSSGDLQVRWDFDGDGTYDTTFSTDKSAEYQYSDAGTYNVTVQVLDTSGQTDTASDTVTTVDNEAPTATFDASPTSGTPGTVFSFDASDVSDSQYKSTYLDVRWDWEGDGDYDTSFSVDKTTTHQYDEADDYTATVQVRDPDGATATYSITIRVISSTAPTASLSVDATEGTFSTLFHFDTTGSSDDETDNDDLLYRWDFDYTGDNDILYDTSWGSTATKSKSFDQTGEIKIRMEVKDGDGEIDSDTVTISIHWASDYMDYLKSKGVLRGYTGGDLAPDQSITRAELLKMTMEGADRSISNHKYQGTFWDVPSTAWYDTYVEVGAEMDIISGYDDGSFRPDDTINRAEAVKMIVNAFDVELETYELGTFSDVQPWDWFGDYVGTAYYYGMVNGFEDGNFYPSSNMTRGEASKIIALAMQGEL